MQIPSVMFIEIAVDTLKTRDIATLHAELKELDALGATNKQPPMRFMTSFEYGYLVGLETARALLATMSGAIKAEVSI